MGRCLDDGRPLLEDYSNLRQWYFDYRDALQTLRWHYNLLANTGLKPPASVALFIDAYELLRYCFPFGRRADYILDTLSDAVERDELFRKHVARACLLHNLGAGVSVILLPPYCEEISDFVEDVRRQNLRLVVTKEVADLILPELDSVVGAVRELDAAAREGRPVASDAMNPLRQLCDEFPEVATAMLGIHEGGLDLLRELRGSGSVKTQLPYAGCADLLDDLSQLLDRGLAGSGSSDTAASDSSDTAAVERAEVVSWIKAFEKIRPGHQLPNLRDAQAIRLTLMCNGDERLMESNVVSLLVSSVDSMHQVLTGAGGRSRFRTPTGESVEILRSIRAFYYHLLLGDEHGSGRASVSQTDEALVQKANLDRVDDQLGRLEAFATAQTSMDKLLGACGIDPAKPLSGGSPRCDQACPLLRDDYREQVSAVLADAAEMRRRTEDAKVLKERYPVLAPYFDRAHLGSGRSVVEKRAAEVLSALREGATWTSLLQVYITGLEREFAADVGGLLADVSPFSDQLSDEFLDLFFDFPFGARFSSRDLAAACHELSSLVEGDGAPPSLAQIQNATRTLRLAAALPGAASEISLVRAVLLLSLRKLRMVVSVAERYNEQHDDAQAHELQQLRARALVDMYEQKGAVVHLVRAQDECVRQLMRYPNDLRFENLYAITLSCLFLDPATKAAEKPALSLVLDHYTRAADRARAEAVDGRREDMKLEANLLNNWAYFLGRLGGDRVSEALRVLRRIRIPHDKWRDGWLHTEGFVHLVAAEGEERPDVQAEEARIAAGLFRQALNVCHSESAKKKILPDLEKAQLLALDDFIPAEAQEAE